MRKRTIPVAVVVLGLLVWPGSTAANKRQPLPTQEVLAGSWIGIDEYGYFTRLVLQSGGKGTFAFRQPSVGGHRVYVFAIDSIEIDRQSIRIALIPSDGDGEHLVLAGRGWLHHLELQVKAGNRRVALHREDEWLAGFDDTKSRMQLDAW